MTVDDLAMSHDNVLYQNVGYLHEADLDLKMLSKRYSISNFYIEVCTYMYLDYLDIVFVILIHSQT